MTQATLNPTTQGTSTSTWTLDASHTVVEFAAKHMMITSVKGRFAEVAGSIRLNEADPARSSVEVEIDASSIDTRSEQRDGHLKSADFLDVENFPKITFRATRVVGSPRAEGDEFQLVGDLTIRDVTREVAVNATYEGRGRDPWGGERIGFSGTARLDRRDFGLTWNAALETGGVLVGNELKLSFEVEAVKAA